MPEQPGFLYSLCNEHITDDELLYICESSNDELGKNPDKDLFLLYVFYANQYSFYYTRSMVEEILQYVKFDGTIDTRKELMKVYIEFEW